jgi:DNA-binding transcriptional ArsR family regulator
VKLNREKLERSAYILKTIAHPTRLMVIGLLDAHGEMSVNEICAKTDCEQSLVSHHLSNMKLKGLLSSRREGTSIRYALKEKNLVAILGCIDKCKCNF